MLAITAVIGGLSGADLRFREHTLATDLKGGYQVVPFDVNHDGKIDLIALASGMTELVWFENPTWERHVMATDVPHMINCRGHEWRSRNRARV